MWVEAYRTWHSFGRNCDSLRRSLKRAGVVVLNRPSGEVKWVEHLACTGESINAHKMSVINPEGKMSVLRLRVGGEIVILK